jgi:23S rRNA (guanosine2251-2'-O)-methyltransferase
MEPIVGVHPVLEALEAGHRQVNRILVQRGRGGPALDKIREAARKRGIPLRLQPRQALDRAAGGQSHQGVVALAEALPLAQEHEVLDAAGERALLLVLDRVEDPRNRGAVVRTAAAAAVQGVFFPHRGSSGLTPAAIKAAAGGTERVPLVQVGNVSSLLTRLKERHIWVVGLDPEGPDLWGGFDWTLPVALVVGGEGKGLRRLTRERCDALVGVPMPGGGGSLNLSVAAALATYEVLRCRRAADKEKTIEIS